MYLVYNQLVHLKKLFGDGSYFATIEQNQYFMTHFWGVTDVWTLTVYHLTAGEWFLGFLVHRLWMALYVCDREIERAFHSFSPSFLCLSFFPIRSTTQCFWTLREYKGIFPLEKGNIFNTTVVPRGCIHDCKRRWGSILARVFFWTWAVVISLWCLVWIVTLE